MRTILRPSAATGEDFAERLDTGAEASVSEAAAAGSGCPEKRGGEKPEEGCEQNAGPKDRKIRSAKTLIVCL